MSEGSGFSWSAAGQLVLSAAGVFLLSTISLGGTLFLVLNRVFGAQASPAGQIDSTLIFLAGIGFSGVLLIPSALAAAGNLYGFEAPGLSSWRGASWLILLVPPLLLAGYAVTQNYSGGRVLLPLIHVLVNGSFVFWLIFQTRKGLDKGSDQRFWGVFGSGLVLSPLLALIVEVFLLLAVGFFWSQYLMSDAVLAEEYFSVVEQLKTSSFDPQLLESLAAEYLLKPGMIITLFLYIAVMIPLVEEVIKTIGVWLLWKKELHPEEGFTLGALSGAGYALFENLTMAAVNEAWVGVVVSRLGTTAVHMITGGIMGWGLVSGWQEKRWGRMVSAYGAAVLIHGAWNGINIGIALAAVPQFEQIFTPYLVRLAEYAPAGLIMLALGALGGLAGANSWIKRAIMTRANSTKGN